MIVYIFLLSLVVSSISYYNDLPFCFMVLVYNIGLVINNLMTQVDFNNFEFWMMIFNVLCFIWSVFKIIKQSNLDDTHDMILASYENLESQSDKL